MKNHFICKVCHCRLYQGVNGSFYHWTATYDHFAVPVIGVFIPEEEKHV